MTFLYSLFTPKTLAVIGALLVALGALLIYPPAGLIAAGVESIIAAYVARYVEVQSVDS